MSILDQKPKSALKEGFGTKFGMGLVIALSLTLAAFQIKAPYSKTETSFTDPFANEGELFTVEPVMSHSREVSVEPPKTPPAEVVNIVIGEPDPIAGPEPLPYVAFDPNASIPSEVIDEPEPPKITTPIRYAEKMPEFPGGTSELLKYLAGTPYCEAAREAGYEGKISVQFIVGIDGSISDIKLLKKIHPCIDQAVIARIKHMPKWEPGYMGKNPVPVIMVAPINFTLTAH